PPTHPGWKRIVLIGGPNDGQELTVKGTRNLIVTGVTDAGEVDPHSVEKGAVYMRSDARLDEDGRERFEFLGHRSTQEIHDLIRGGYVAGGDLDDDPADDWKK